MMLTPQDIRRHAGAALHILDNLPEEDSPETRKRLAETIEHLVRLRDELVAARRAGEPCDPPLRAANAVLSSIFGTEFPVHGLQWKRVCETRDAIRRWLNTESLHAAN
jgi:hypothetical protein